MGWTAFPREDYVFSCIFEIRLSVWDNASLQKGCLFSRRFPKRIQSVTPAKQCRVAQEPQSGFSITRTACAFQSWLLWISPSADPGSADQKLQPRLHLTVHFSLSFQLEQAPRTEFTIICIQSRVSKMTNFQGTPNDGDLIKNSKFSWVRRLGNIAQLQNLFNFLIYLCFLISDLQKRS